MTVTQIIPPRSDESRRENENDKFACLEKDLVLAELESSDESSLSGKYNRPANVCKIVTRLSTKIFNIHYIYN